MEHLHVLGFISYVSKIRDYDMQNVARARVPSATPGGFALSDWPVERASAGG